MSTLLLCPSAERVIDVMSLGSQENAIFIRESVSRYTTPNTFCNTLVWVFYRIVNAVKAIFGRSDWQVAKDIIYTRAYDMAKGTGLIQANPQSPRDEKINTKVLEVLNMIADDLLDVCLLAHEEKAEMNDEFREEVLVKLNMEARMGEIRDLVSSSHTESSSSEVREE